MPNKSKDKGKGHHSGSTQRSASTTSSNYFDNIDILQGTSLEDSDRGGTLLTIRHPSNPACRANIWVTAMCDPENHGTWTIFSSHLDAPQCVCAPELYDVNIGVWASEYLQGKAATNDFVKIKHSLDLLDWSRKRKKEEIQKNAGLMGRIEEHKDMWAKALTLVKWVKELMGWPVAQGWPEVLLYVKEDGTSGLKLQPGPALLGSHSPSITTGGEGSQH